MKSEPFVSIALATYRNAAFLGEQLDSLLAQTYRNLEIVITDDGSTDGTQEILSEYATKDSRVRWSKSTRERGVVNNFSEAIALCKGEIVFLCDGDDVWYPEKVSKHMGRYTDPRVMWVYNEVVITNKNRQPIAHLTDTIPDYYTRRKFTNYTWGSCVLGCATSYRASCIRSIWPADLLAPGHDSWIQLAIYPARPSYIPEVLQEYRQHETNAVGIQVDSTTEESLSREKRAVRDNMRYLESLCGNTRLSFWKRNLLSLILFGKRARAAVRKS